MAFYAGYQANFTFNAITNRCRKWDFNVDKARIDVTYMTAAVSRWRRYLSGFNAGEISADGPHDPAFVLPFEADVVAYVLLIGGAFSISGNCAVIGVGIGTDIEGAAAWRIRGAVDEAPVIT